MEVHPRVLAPLGKGYYCRGSNIGQFGSDFNPRPVRGESRCSRGLGSDARVNEGPEGHPSFPCLWGVGGYCPGLGPRGVMDGFDFFCIGLLSGVGLSLIVLCYMTDWDEE